MPPSSVPRNAYTNAPEQHPNWILGSLQLLWWMVFRPSAFRNHLKRIDPDLNFESNQRRRLRWRNLALWKLLFQGFIILPVLANLLLGLVLLALGESLEEVVPRVAVGVAWGVAFGVAGGVAWGVAFGVAFGVTGGVAWGVAFGVAWGVAFGVAGGVAFSVAVDVAGGVAVGVAWGVAGGVAVGVAWGVVIGVAWGVAGGVAGGVALGVALGVGATIHSWRPVLLYPFLSIWSTLLYQLDKRRKGDKPSLLRWHSAFWDEWQYLPLYGLDKHVVLVVERNPAEGQAALDYLLDYLSTSRQRWAARAAQIELDARDLERRIDVVAIGNAHHQLTPGELESPVSALLRSFNRISEDVNAALKQRSAYHQRLALTAVADRLDGLLRELTRSSDKYAVRFRPIATRWCEIVTNYVAKLAQAVELRQEIDSPYIIGVPLTTQQDIFTGRTNIASRIEQLLLDRRRPPLLLYGQRRMGKTSLLNNLGHLLPNSIIPMFVDLQGAPSSARDHASFLYNLARGMSDSAKRQSNLTLPPLTRETLAADPFTSFDEWLDEVEQALGQNIALLSLDEFEVLDSAIAKERFDEQDVLGMLRHLIQHRPRFKVLLSGSHTIEEFQRWASYLINVQVVHISYLNEPEARQLIKHPVKDFALRYEPDAVQHVLDLTRCHPCLVQLLCSEIVAFKNEQDVSIRRFATVADVENAVPEALSSGSFFFADIERNQVNDAGLELLRFLAAFGEGAIVSWKRLSRQFPDNTHSILDLLVRRELIEQVDDGYRFQVELIRRWFARER